MCIATKVLKSKIIDCKTNSHKERRLKFLQVINTTEYDMLNSYQRCFDSIQSNDLQFEFHLNKRIKSEYSLFNSCATIYEDLANKTFEKS